MQELLLESSNRDFQKLADKITSDFFNHERPLLDKTIEEARAEELNPEEVKRLSEKVNTNAVVKLLKNSEDKKSSIPLVDYTAVLAVTHPEEREEDTGSQVKTASLDLPNTREKKSIKNIEFPTLEKAAQERRKVLPEIFKAETELQKVANEKVALESKVQDNVDYIVSEFYKWRSPDFSKFASEAYTLKGEDAKPVLNKMASYLETDVDYTEVPYVDDSDKLIAKFAEVIDGIKKLSTLQLQKDEYKEKLDNLWREAKQNGY